MDLTDNFHQDFNFSFKQKPLEQSEKACRHFKNQHTVALNNYICTTHRAQAQIGSPVLSSGTHVFSVMWQFFYSRVLTLYNVRHE